MSRFLAAAIDLGVVFVGLLAAYLTVSAVRFLLSPRRFSWPTPGLALLGALFWWLLVVYLTAGWTISGRTLGKQLMGLRVTNRAGDRPHLGVSFLRALLCAAIPLGLFWCAVSQEHRSLADVVFRTSVVYDWRVRVPRAAEGVAAAPIST